MAERPCIDSNILVYAVAGQGAKRTIALEVVGQGGVISVQALGETAHVLRRKAGLSLSEVGDALFVLRALLEVVPLTIATHDEALRIAALTDYSIWDATMLAAALEAGCDELISEDMQHGRAIDELIIRNPFARLPG